jgi:hypothetical protein
LKSWQELGDRENFCGVGDAWGNTAYEIQELRVLVPAELLYNQSRQKHNQTCQTRAFERVGVMLT